MIISNKLPNSSVSSSEAKRISIVRIVRVRGDLDAPKPKKKQTASPKKDKLLRKMKEKKRTNSSYRDRHCHCHHRNGPQLTWFEATRQAIKRYVCATRSTVFTKKAFEESELDRIIAQTRGTGKTPLLSLSRVLQDLRDAGELEFVDNRGKCKWLG